MEFGIEIHMDNTEGVLERVLGRLRQRGFSICAIVCNRSTDRTLLNARLTVESTRLSELAEKQLGKLHDVQYVRVETINEQSEPRRVSRGERSGHTAKELGSGGNDAGNCRSGSNRIDGDEAISEKALEETNDHGFEHNHVSNTAEFNLPLRHYA